MSNQLCDWSRKLEQVSKPIRCITNSNDDLVGAFSRALGGSLVFTLRFHWIFDIFSFLLTLVLVLRHKIKKKLCYAAGHDTLMFCGLFESQERFRPPNDVL